MTLKNETELSGFLQEAQKPVWIEGGATQGIRGEGDEALDTISTRGLSGITHYEPGALTIVAKAGTPVREIETALTSEGQHLPFEPMDHRTLLGSNGEPTIGGVVAGNSSGPRRIQSGACRDCLIGVRFVDGSGNIIKNGGQVMKNVTGYDIVKLMAGSYGTLGVLSEVSFKVLPKPEAAATLVLHGLDDKSAIAACSKALGSPFDITGAACVPDISGSKTYLRIEGFEQSVAYRIEQLKTLFKEHELSVATDSAEIWQSIRDVVHFRGHDGDVWRISVKPTDGPICANQLREKGVDAKVSYDWGGGLVWVAVPTNTDLRAELGSLRGYATLVKGSNQKRFHPQNSILSGIEQGLRRKFDPKEILNHGLMC